MRTNIKTVTMRALGGGILAHDKALQCLEQSSLRRQVIRLRFGLIGNLNINFLLYSYRPLVRLEPVTRGYETTRRTVAGEDGDT